MLAQLAATLRQRQTVGGALVDGAGEGATIVLDENCTVSSRIILGIPLVRRLKMFCSGDVSPPRWIISKRGQLVNWPCVRFFDVIIRHKLPTLLYTILGAQGTSCPGTVL